MDIDLNITIDNSCGNGLINVINNSNGVIDHLWDMGDEGRRTADVNHSSIRKTPTWLPTKHYLHQGV